MTKEGDAVVITIKYATLYSTTKYRFHMTKEEADGLIKSLKQRRETGGKKE